MRANNFDFIRFFLATLVILSHSWPLANGGGPRSIDFLARLDGGQLDAGALAVDSFFVVSGLLISQSWDRSRGFLDFMNKRVRRVYPAFLVMSVITAIVIVPAFAEHRHAYTPRDIGILTFDAFDLVGYGFPYGNTGLVAFAHNPYPRAINGALWTIRYEFVCYVALGAAATAGALRHQIAPLAAFAAFLILSVAHVHIPSHWVVTALIGDVQYWPRFATYFLAGTVWHRCRIPVRGAFAALGLLVTILASRFGFLLAVLPVTLPAMIFWLAERPGPLTRFGSRGDFSYGMYIYGFLVQQMVVALLPGITVAELFALSLPATVALGVCSWLLVERRFLKARVHPKVLQSEPLAPLSQ